MRPTNKLRWVQRQCGKWISKYPAIEIVGTTKVQVLQQLFEPEFSNETEQWVDVPLDIEK